MILFISVSILVSVHIIFKEIVKTRISPLGRERIYHTIALP